LDHKHVLVLDFLDHGDTVCWLLTMTIFCKSLRLLRQSIVLLHENARCHTPNWSAVYGCKSDMLWISPNLASVFYLSMNPWEAPGWQVIALDADVKQVITSWLQTLDDSVFTL
jgi:hypothetical protein